ncbi:MAG: trigger factor [Clostridia bacterium]
MATIEKLTGSKVKLGFEVSAEQVESALQQAYVKTGKRFNVPGFRKGKAPRKMIENAYGPLAFFDDAFDILYPDLYEAAVIEHKIEPVDRPEVSVDDVGEGKALKFSVEVAVKPEVTLGAYKGIEVEKHEYNVTDEMLDAAMQREQEKVARFVDVERPIQDGDNVTLDYSGSVDGVKFDGGTAEDQQLVIGSGSFIPGFEEQMVGMNNGEEHDIKVKFPDEYHSEELAGKEAVFAIKVKGIQVKELPTLDDEFAKDVSEFDTIAQLRDDKHRELMESAVKQAKTYKENAAIKAAVDNATVEIPDAMVNRQINNMLQDISYKLSMQGITLEDYYKYTGSTEQAVRDEMRVDAAERVKTQLVLGEIRKAEDIKADEAEIKAKVQEYALKYGQNADEMYAKFNDDDKAYFEDQAIWEKTVALIADSAIEIKAKKAASTKAEKKNDDEKEPAAKKTVKKTDADKKPAAKKVAAKKSENTDTSKE